MLPHGVRDLMSASGDQLALYLDGGHVRICQLDSGAPVGTSHPPTAADDAEAWRKISALAGKGKPPSLTFIVPSSACLERRIEIPKKARHNAGRILELDLERATPFKLQDVLTAYVVDPAPGPKGNLSARQFILKRETVARALAAADRTGATVRRIGCVSSNGAEMLPVTFLDATAAGPRTRNGGWVRKLAVGLLLLAGLATALATWRNERALATLDRQTAEIRKQLGARDDHGNGTGSAAQDVAAVQVRKAHAVPAVVLVDEITQRLPDDTYLSELRLSGRTIELSGLSRRASDLVGTLEKSPYFGDATLTAPVTFDSNADRERFNLRLTLRQASAVSGETVEEDQ
ncbi:PilN domain-containing protein [Hyphomicrobium sp.]|uniref:PilN domain-containing protein n=1 Tax=Hyphomicrobium sp. TaxID=82 RepID=UPI002E3709ED|nr:PilN domain-containing protein [Hyphomicrobium sp.]HEX2841003.1 PilN domain-containing protein [Hyphomicrobium sp.]